MPAHPPRIFTHIHPNVASLPNIDVFVTEFRKYKELAFVYAVENDCSAADFLPTLTEDDQQSLPPDHILFGRDRLFYGKGMKAANDPLYHVHIFKPDDDKCIWHEEGKSDVNQWYCTSDAALIYAYMKNDSDDFNFLILEVVDPGAHAKYKEDGAVEHWRRLVIAYRASNGI